MCAAATAARHASTVSPPPGPAHVRGGSAASTVNSAACARCTLLASNSFFLNDGAATIAVASVPLPPLLVLLSARSAAMRARAAATFSTCSLASRPDTY